MVITHAFYKDSSESIKQCTKKFFEELEPIQKVKLDRYVPAIQSIRQIMGENFYDLENSKDDIITLMISDEGSFNFKSINADINVGNYKVMNEVSSFVVSLFSQFSKMYGNVIIGKDFEDVKFKVAILSSKGLIAKELDITDFASLSSFDADGNVNGFRGMTELSELNDELTAADQAAKKIQSTGGAASNAAAETLSKQIFELQVKLINKYLDIIEGFFDLIEKWGEVDSVTDIWNVTFIFNMVVVDHSSENSDSLVETDIISLHDGAHRNFMALKSKFE